MVYTRLKIYIYINNSISHQKAIHIHHGILEKKTKTICLLFATPCVCPCWSCRWELAQAAGSSLAAFPGLVHGNLCICHPRYAIYMYIYIYRYTCVKKIPSFEHMLQRCGIRRPPPWICCIYVLGDSKHIDISN